MSPHAQFGGFRFVPYSSVLALVNDLDDRVYNTLPPQPKPKPQAQKGKPSAKKTASQAPVVSGSGTSEEPVPRIQLSDTPPDDNPLQEPNVWCSILKLEGRVHQNNVAEGMENWLKKNIDSSLFEVQTKCLFIVLLKSNTS